MGNWMSQYRKYEIMPALVRPADAGRWFGRFAKLGHIAVSIWIQTSAIDLWGKIDGTHRRNTGTTIASMDSKPEHG
jgi:hypothetical protein